MLSYTEYGDSNASGKVILDRVHDVSGDCAEISIVKACIHNEVRHVYVIACIIVLDM